MSWSPWRFVLTALLLIALPLKGLAAVGCAPVAALVADAADAGTPAAVPQPAQDAHGAHAGAGGHVGPHAAEATACPHPCADAHDPDAASADEGDSACSHCAPCCVSLALGHVPAFSLPDSERPAAPAARVIAIRPAPAGSFERPPRA